MSMQRNDLSASFQKLMNHSFEKVNGCLVERTGKGFRWNNTYYSNRDEVTAAIEKATSYLRNSLKTAA